MDERLIEWKTYGITEVNTPTLIVTLVMIAYSLFGSRRSAIAPFLITIAILPSIERIVIFGLDFSMVRLLVIASWTPYLFGPSGGPFRWKRLNSIDKSLVVWALVGALIYIVRKGSGGAIIFKAGILLDMFGVYFIIRQRVWQSSQFIFGLKVFALLAIIIGSATAVEFGTGRNCFSVFGSASDVTLMRNGEFRATSSFSHPILSGTFGALLVSMMIGLWKTNPRSRILAAVAGIGGLQIVLASNSSGPLIAMVFGIGCWLMWFIRAHLTPLRWTILILGVIVHFAREKPIWHLILRMGEVMGGGTGYHRYYLIEATVHHWRDWLVIGTEGVAGWGWGLQDLTNQWVFEAVNGGILTLVAFNVLLFLCFYELGRSFIAIKETPNLSAKKKRRLLFLGWTMGITLAVYCISFISVALFGQMGPLFYLHLALISSFTMMPEIRRGETRHAPNVDESESALAANSDPPSHVTDSPNPTPTNASLGKSLQPQADSPIVGFCRASS